MLSEFHGMFQTALHFTVIELPKILLNYKKKKIFDMFSVTFFIRVEHNWLLIMNYFLGSACKYYQLFRTNVYKHILMQNKRMLTFLSSNLP